MRFTETGLGGAWVIDPDPHEDERFRVSTPESRYDTEGTLRFFDEVERRFGIDFAERSVHACVVRP